jgi:hypothetical protein
MRRFPAAALALCAGALTASPVAIAPDAALAVAGPQSRPARDCFFARSVNGFRPVGRDAVDVTISRNRRYRLTLVGYCPDVDWSLGIALRTRAGSSFICAGLDAEILVPSQTGPQRCAVTEVRRLSPQEIDAARRTRR